MAMGDKHVKEPTFEQCAIHPRIPLQTIVYWQLLFLQVLKHQGFADLWMNMMGMVIDTLAFAHAVRVTLFFKFLKPLASFYRPEMRDLS